MQDLTHADQVRDEDMRHTQREHTKVNKKLTEIEPCLAQANYANVRLRTDVKVSKKRA